MVSGPASNFAEGSSAAGRPAEVESPSLGVGFRLYARFYTGSDEGALTVPRFSVFQVPDQSFYVFVVEGDELRKRLVKIGLRSDLELQIVEGLSTEDLVVSAPDSTISEGMRVRPNIREP